MKNLKEFKVTTIGPEGRKIQKLGDFITLDLKDYKIKEEKDVLEYARIVYMNQKQKQSTKPQAGMSQVLISPGTNKGKSRQKYADFGYTSRTMGAPNNVGGRIANAFFSNQTKLKMNKKVKRLMVRTLLYHTLKKAEIYVLEDLNKSAKTNQFLKNLTAFSHYHLKDYLVEPRKGTNPKLGPALLVNGDYEKFFLNYPNVLNLRTSSNYFGLYKGFRLRKVLIGTKKELSDLIEKYFT